ncbi:MAG: hypothetical protein PHG91_02610 [Syntrophales bacterium]|nr:hypothetical protein [Syntrophales bacterium]MDD5232264.1 hypothetical protein [Syntrophales bacterium]MDD5531399.1 hypothetical protein [Syntrophales bacterium]HPL62620.1 hypothetical protein [Syntrophales bacterium]
MSDPVYINKYELHALAGFIGTGIIRAALVIIWFLFVFYSCTYLHCLIDPESDRVLGVQVKDADLYK